jgi:phage shock protein C
MNSQFVRTRGDKMVAGVCGGLARYFNIDPVLVRLVFVLAVLSGVSPLIYLVLWIVMPEEPVVTPVASLPSAPANVEQWQYDPYTGQPIKR